MSSPSRNTPSSRSSSSHRASAIATRYVASPASVRLPRGSAPWPAAPASTCCVGTSGRLRAPAAARRAVPVAVLDPQALGEIAGFGERRGERVLESLLELALDQLLDLGDLLLGQDALCEHPLFEPLHRVL